MTRRQLEVEAGQGLESEVVGFVWYLWSFEKSGSYMCNLILLLRLFLLFKIFLLDLNHSEIHPLEVLLKRYRILNW